MMQEFATFNTLDDLLKQMKDKGQRFTESHVRYMSAQLLLGLAHAHNKGVLHRDIKGPNIFLMLSGDLKIGDWGCSYKVSKTRLSKGQIWAASGIGSWNYMAPEIVMIETK